MQRSIGSGASLERCDVASDGTDTPASTAATDAADAPRWLWRQWHNVQLLRNSGVPIIGFTWYSLTDQIDWDRAIEEPLGVVDPVGLVDLNRDPRPVGLSYKHLIDMHRDQPEYRDCKPLQEVLA